jgi:hypothetical protein
VAESRAASLAATFFGGKLPPDVLADVRRRLRIASLACFLAMLVTLLAHLALVRIGWDPAYKWQHMVACTVSMLASLALYFLFGWRRLKPEWLLNVAAFAAWQLCFSLSMMELKGPDSRLPGDRFGCSLVCVVIVLLPILIPAPPWKTLLFSLLYACAGPVACTALRHHPGYESWRPTLEQYFNLYALNYIAAGLALAPAFVLGQLREELKEARDLGSYKLLEKLGQGGMGEVWRAEHRLLARPAAIKLIKGLADPAQAAEMHKRFEREAQATAALRSPHTVAVYDYGVAGDGTFHYVMELLEGMSLQALVERHGPVPPERAVHLLRQACHSLAEAHAAGLVHRDIKPANLFLCRVGLQVDFVKVLDFGLVKVRGSEASGTEAITVQGAFTGTPAFMPPEVAVSGDTVDGRADLYSLGCVAYWLLTGRLVFEGRGAMQMVLDHVRTPPPRPSSLGAQPIPPDLEALVLRCLAKDPDQRPPSAAALARHLDCLDVARWTDDRAQAWWDVNGPGAIDPAASSASWPTMSAAVPRSLASAG